MRPVALATGFMLLLATLPAAAQINPADMRSGFVTYSDVIGLVSSSLFFVPSGYRFVLTDVTVSRVSGSLPMPAGNGDETVRLTINYGGTTSVPRWVATDRMTASDPPLQLHWNTGLV